MSPGRLSVETGTEIVTVGGSKVTPGRESVTSPLVLVWVMVTVLERVTVMARFSTAAGAASALLMRRRGARRERQGILVIVWGWLRLGTWRMRCEEAAGERAKLEA